MAQRIAGFGKKAVAARAAASARVAAELSTPIRSVPLELAPLVAPYRKRGRVTLRVENLARRARFSAGHNNGDGSWSLASDELEDLAYLVPGDVDEAHTLAVRIIALDGGDASTLAVLEVPVAAPDLPPEDEDAFAGVSSELLVRRGPPANVNSTSNVQPLVSKGDAAPSLLVTPGLEERALSEAVAARQRAEEELRQARDACDTLRTALNASETELARVRAASEQAAETHRREVTSVKKAAAADASARDQSGEVARLRNDSEALRTALNASEAELARLRSASELAAEAHRRELISVKKAVAADASARDQSGEVTRLRNDCEALRTALNASETELARLRASSQQTLESLRREAEEAKASTVSKADQAVRDLGKEIERLRGQLSAVQATLAERDAALAKAQAAVEETRERSRKDSEAAMASAEEARDRARKESEAAVASAEKAWKAREEARFAATERQWKEQSAKELAAAERQWREHSAKELGAALAHCERTESALKEARAQADRAVLSASQHASDEVRRLREECAALRAAVADRDGEMSQLRTAGSQERESWRLEMEGAISKAQTAWKAEEAERMAAAEAQWLEKTKKALAAVRAEVERDHGNERELARLRAELAVMHAKLMNRESEVVQRPAVIEPIYNEPPAGPRIVLRTDRGWEEEKPVENKTRAWRYYIRDAALVAVVAAGAFLLYPIFGSGSLDELRTKISMMVTDTEEPPAPPPAAPVKPAPPPPVVLPQATIVRGANLRSEPSTSGSVVTTLPRGTKAEVVKTDGNWTMIKTGDTQGWVYSTFIQTDSKPN